MDFYSHQLNPVNPDVSLILGGTRCPQHVGKAAAALPPDICAFRRSISHRLQDKSIHLDAVLSQKFSAHEILRRAIGK
jgi:hypothetical protein